MNTNPVARNAAHAEALEAYRMSEATLYRFINHENVSNGRGMSWLQTQSQYQALVEIRDVARAAVEQANPAGAGDAVEEANPAGKPPKEKAKK